MLAVKIVDKILLTVIRNVIRKFITEFNAKLKLGEILNGPGN